MSTTSIPPYQATRLTPYTRYRVQIRYVNRAGGGQWSNLDQLVFRTLAGSKYHNHLEIVAHRSDPWTKFSDFHPFKASRAGCCTCVTIFILFFIFI